MYLKRNISVLKKREIDKETAGEMFPDTATL